MRVVVTGGTGFIGKRVVRALLEGGNEVVALTRDVEKAKAKVDARATLTRWAGGTVVDESIFAGADAVIHLAGEGVADERWTDERKARLRSSRVDTTTAIANALAAMKKRPSVFVSASAIGYYGFRNDGSTSDETDAPGSDFLATICVEWENAANAAREAGVRVVHPRIGIVLGKDGGALKEMMVPFKLFAGGPIGTGKQIMSWIHVDDVVRAILFPLEEAGSSLVGPYNATAPNPVSMNVFADTLGRVMGRPSIARVPSFVIETVLGKERAHIVLDGHNVLPAKLKAARFEFRYPNLESALRELLA